MKALPVLNETHGLTADKRALLRHLWLSGTDPRQIAAQIGMLRGEVLALAAEMRLPENPLSDNGRKWGPLDEELKRLFLEERLPVTEIATRLRRTVRAVVGRIKRLHLARPRLPRVRKVTRAVVPLAAMEIAGDPRRRAKIRRCLGPCGEMFLSKGAHHRICDGCRATVNTLAGGGDNEYSAASARTKRHGGAA